MSLFFNVRRRIRLKGNSPLPSHFFKDKKREYAKFFNFFRARKKEGGKNSDLIDILQIFWPPKKTPQKKFFFPQIYGICVTPKKKKG